MTALLEVGTELIQVVRDSPLRAESAQRLVDHAVANPTFSVAEAVTVLDLSQPRVKTLIDQLVGLGVLAPYGTATYARRFHAPRVWDVLLDRR